MFRLFENNKQRSLLLDINNIKKYVVIKLIFQGLVTCNPRNKYRLNKKYIDVHLKTNVVEASSSWFTVKIYN